MKQIPDFPDYCATKNGRIWSRPRKGSGCNMKGRWIKPFVASHGYDVARLQKNKHTYCRRVHRLILETFVGKRPKGMECRHLDGNKQNNNLDNLKWDTHSNNMKDMTKHGTQYIPDFRGEKQWQSKLTEKQVRTIVYIWQTRLLTQKEIAEMYKIDQSHVSDIVNKKRWAHIWAQKGDSTINKKSCCIG